MLYRGIFKDYAIDPFTHTNALVTLYDTRKQRHETADL